MFKIYGLGRLVADPELQEIKSNEGKSTYVARFTLASNEYRKVNDEKVTYTSFFDCEVWDTGAKALCDIVQKGDLIAVTGRPRQNKWETQDGEKRSRIIFRVEEFDLARKAAKNEQQSDEQ